jgi:rhodanese-related sulfurtransferase
MTVATISPAELERIRATTSLVLIDVRSPGEFASLHLAGSQLIPLEAFDPSELALPVAGGDGRIYLICGSGTRATVAAQRFKTRPDLTPVVLDGGIRSWSAAGLPVTRGRGAISLERQVRIAAGLLVLIGLVLGWRIQATWLLLSAAVAIGLVFAGISGTCGMASILLLFPWNRRPGTLV